MEALILSPDYMSLEDITFGYYYKMNPSRKFGIYYDFVLQLWQMTVILIWPLNLIFVPSRWMLELTQWIQKLIMDVLFPFTELPESMASVKVNLSPFSTVVTIINYLNL